VTGALSFVLSNLLPWYWSFTGFDKHHWYGYPLQTDLGILVPTVAVILAAFFFVYGLFVGVGNGLSGEVVFYDQPEDYETPRLDALIQGPDEGLNE
jgi:hypothetical protein